MELLLRTNDAVLLSFAQALLKDAGIESVLFDQNMSIIEGSIGILPRRLLVPSGSIDAARRLLREAGIGKELAPPPPVSEA
jgi:hypothetical protein